MAEKGVSSSDVKAHLLDADDEGKEPTGKLKSVDELLTLSYLSYLDQNNYIKADKRYLFGDLLKSGDGLFANASAAQSEQIFLFLEMLKVFFPGGDSLVAPLALQ